jgi:hypothetical protein
MFTAATAAPAAPRQRAAHAVAPVRCVSHAAASTSFKADHQTAQSGQSHEHHSLSR